MAEELAGIILAGGQARRMGGGDKALLPLGGTTVLDCVIARLAPQVAMLALNANGDPARFSRFGLKVMADGVPGHPGPLAGILAAMDFAAERGFGEVVTAAADTPFLPLDLVARFKEKTAESGAPIILAATRDEEGKLQRHPVFGLWRVSLRNKLRAALADGLSKVQLWADHNGAAMAEFPAGPVDPFFNINRPEDLAEAQRLFSRV